MADNNQHQPLNIQAPDMGQAQTNVAGESFVLALSVNLTLDSEIYLCNRNKH